MIYAYKCDDCEHEFDVVKSVAQMDDPEKCEKCDHSATRQFIPNAGSIIGLGMKVEDSYYCPALGQVIHSKRQREELAKQRGMVEVGNEKPETLHKEAKKTLDHNLAKRWKDI